MGFEPFIPPKRPEVKPPEGSREEKVLALAKLLHARGITSSMTDAKRLAEGMVDVERKVVKQETKTVALAHAEHADIADTNPHGGHSSAFSLALTESFAHFVAQAAAISHANARPVEIPSAHQEPLSYGREQSRPVAEVPHAHAHKQVFFQDAPSLAQTRGFKDTPQQVVEFTIDRVPPSTSEFTEVSASDSGVKVTKVETQDQTVVVEERVLIRDEPETEEQPVDLPEPEPQSKAQPVREDLAKKHGVDLFEMFKKK